MFAQSIISSYISRITPNLNKEEKLKKEFPSKNCVKVLLELNFWFGFGCEDI